MTLTTRTPPSVSCQTIPSNVTDVPGSHGPRQSGSVIVPTDVPTQMSTMSRGSHLIFFAGGGLVLSSRFDDEFEPVADTTDDVDEFVTDDKCEPVVAELLPFVDDDDDDDLPEPIDVVTETVDANVLDADDTEFDDDELFVFALVLLVFDRDVVVDAAVDDVDAVDIIDAEDGGGC